MGSNANERRRAPAVQLDCYAAEGAWDKPNYVLDSSRYLEHTDDGLHQRLKALDTAAIDNSRSCPRSSRMRVRWMRPRALGGSQTFSSGKARSESRRTSMPSSSASLEHRRCALVAGNIEKPSDFDAVVYIQYGSNTGWKTELARELRHAGIKFDATRVF